MKPTKEMFDDARMLHVGRVAAYSRGEMSDAAFRPVRLSYGLYYQLDHTSYMQRIKLPGGLMTVEQMETLADVTDAYGRGITHLTTRQDMQIHWVPLAEVGAMYERLEGAGITTRGACADSIRNVTACPFAGISPDEPFDVTPHMLAIHDYFLFNPLNLTLPRKFKIAIEGCPIDCAQASINDIGLYARIEGGRRGFSVWAGGGLGAAPFVAVQAIDFLPEEDVLIGCEAIVRIHHRSGERRNRHKARLKFLVKKLGEERFREMIREEIAQIEAESGDELRQDVRDTIADFRIPEPAGASNPVAPREGFDAWRRTNSRAQRQAGWFAVSVTLPLGDMTAEQLRGVARLARELGNGTARATNEQNLVLPWIHPASLPRLHAELIELELAEPDASLLTDVVSCPGLDYCSLAVTRSMGVGERIREHLRQERIDTVQLGPFHVKVSGCPNSCGQHHIGDIGLTGMMVKDEEGVERPHYSLLVGGGVGEGETRIGRRLFGRYPEAETPKAIVALAQHYQTHRRPGEGFPAFVERVGRDTLDEVAQRAIDSAVR